MSDRPNQNLMILQKVENALMAALQELALLQVQSAIADEAAVVQHEILGIKQESLMDLRKACEDNGP